MSEQANNNFSYEIPAISYKRDPINWDLKLCLPRVELEENRYFVEKPHSPAEDFHGLMMMTMSKNMPAKPTVTSDIFKQALSIKFGFTVSYINN